MVDPPLRVLFKSSLSFLPRRCGCLPKPYFRSLLRRCGRISKPNLCFSPRRCGWLQEPDCWSARHCGPASYLGYHIAVAGAFSISCRRGTISALAAVAVQRKMESYGLWPTSFVGVMEKVGFRDAPAVAEAAKILIARPMNPLPPDLMLKRMPLFGDAGGGLKRVSRRCGHR